MAPLKFEEHIKEKLEQRKLQPSADAWQKLNDQLDDDASKKNNKTFWWIGIAASIVGVLLVVTVVINSKNESSIMPTIVDTENIDSNIRETSNDLEEGQDKTQEIKDENESSIENSLEASKSKKPSLLKQKIHTEQNKLVPIKTNDAVAEGKQIDESKIKKTNVIKSLTSEELRINAVVAEMQKLQEQNKSALDSELDALLSEAQKEIALEKLYKEAIKSVNAEALLEDVEEDLDASFRSRVFKALQESYKTVKSAVAERNN